MGLEIDVGPSSRSAHRTLPPGVLAPSSRTRRDAAPFRQGDPRKDGMAHRDANGDANGAVRLVQQGVVGLPMSQADQTSQRNTGISWHLVLYLKIVLYLVIHLVIP